MLKMAHTLLKEDLYNLIKTLSHIYPKMGLIRASNPYKKKRPFEEIFKSKPVENKKTIGGNLLKSHFFPKKV